MQANNLVFKIYQAVSTEDRDGIPFSQCKKEENALYEIMERIKDKDLYSDLEWAQYELRGAIEADAFCVGFRTAAQLYFQLIGGRLDSGIR